MSLFSQEEKSSQEALHRNQCTGYPEGVFEDGDYFLGGWGRAALYKAPFASSSCFDNQQNGDEEGIDCGGSCSACGTGGYFGCCKTTKLVACTVLNVRTEVASLTS